MIEGVINYMNKNIPWMYTQIYNTTSRGLDFNGNMKRIRESVDKTLSNYIKNEKIRIGVYIYIIEKKLNS